VLGVRLSEGDPLPEPWDSFSLRGFAAGLFESDASFAQAHVHSDEEHALALVGIPAQPEGDTVLIVLDDLTEQERRELAEREFVTNAAHELRTPLTTIIGAVEVLQGGAKDDPIERDRFLAHIEREASGLRALARALLTLARAQRGQEQPRVEAVRAYGLAAGGRRRDPPDRRRRARDRLSAGAARDDQPRPPRAGAAEPRRERGAAHAGRSDRVARVRGRYNGNAWRSRTPAAA